MAEAPESAERLIGEIRLRLSYTKSILGCVEFAAAAYTGFEMVEAEPRRIIIVGDDRLAIEGLSHVLGNEIDPRQIVTAAPSDAAVDEADVCIWDLGANPPGELELPPGPPVVALVPDGALARQAFAAGARGALLRDASARRIARAIDAVLDGLVVLDDELAEEAMRPPMSSGLTTMEPLTPRELEVLEQLALGLSNKDIASRLGVSPHTAKFHVNSLISKLGATSRTEVVAMAARAGLVTF